MEIREMDMLWPLNLISRSGLPSEEPNCPDGVRKPRTAPRGLSCRFTISGEFDGQQHDAA
ncbi:hypothetical protein WOLCODRAFT_26522, partial [Wolfiporia cocos MD-104 SS10]